MSDSTSNKLWVGPVIAVALAAASPALAAELVPQVYRDEAVTVRAGLSGLGSRVVEFGSVQELVVTITYDPDLVSMEEPGAGFFTSAWPPEKGPFLIEWTADEVAAGGGARMLQAKYRFQLLGCPNGGFTCPGTKIYPVPEFSLGYQLGHEDAVSHAVRFRPWPSRLLVTPGIPMDDEERPYPFAEYFPTGAYPEPLSGTTSARAPIAFFGVGFVALLGGLLMWPFGSRKEKPFAAGSTRRWQVLLQELENDAEPDESHLYDRLRRCVVWYCTDELGADPYAWVDSSSEPVPVGADENVIELRRLFLEVLQNEPRQAANLQARFASLIGRR